MNDYPAALLVFAWVGLFVTVWAASAAAFYANFRLMAWWNRRQARTTTGGNP